MQTNDFALLGASVTLSITPISQYIDAATVLVEPLNFIVDFSTNGPKFSEAPSAAPLRCDISDSNWFMDVPDVQFQDQLSAKVMLDPKVSNNRLFGLNTANQVILNLSNKQNFIEGKLCPPNGFYDITFLLESPVAGDSRIQVPLTIESDIDNENRFDPSEYLGEGSEQWIGEGVERPVLQPDNIVTTFDGKIVVKFPTEFVVPDNWESINQKRNLFEQQAIEIVVKPVGEQTQEDVEFDWKIGSFTQTEIEFDITFSNPY